MSVRWFAFSATRPMVAPGRPASGQNAGMPQRDIELILFRQLASSLAVPILLVDEKGDLLFFNEPAELLLGQRFDEVGEMPLEERRRAFAFRDQQGNPLPDDQPPLVVALREQRPVHRLVSLRGFDGVYRALEVTAFPLLGAGGHLIGGVVMFWERTGARGREQGGERGREQGGQHAADG
jgi:PAS domain-containing protein